MKCPAKYEFGSKRKLLSANMHMAESTILVRRLYAGNAGNAGNASVMEIESGVQYRDREAVLCL